MPDRPESTPAPSFTEYEILERRLWRNWSFLVAMILFSVIGMVTGRFAGLRERVAAFWPWAGTETALMVGLSLIVLLFTAHLTRQQRRVIVLRRRLQASLRESDARARKNLDRILSLLTVTRVLAKETDPQSVFDCITRTCLDTFACGQVSMMVRVPDSDELEIRSATGHENVGRILGQRVKIGEGIAGWVAQNRKPLVLGRKADNGAGLELKQKRLTAAMVVPIVVRDELMGILNVSSRNEDAVYGEEDLRVLSVFAEYAGVASRHAEQAQWMRATIQRMDQELSELQARDTRAA